MSAIAEFIKIPRSAVNELRASAVPRKSFFGKLNDRYHHFLRGRGSEVVEYKWSGYVFNPLLCYLHEKRAIDLTKSEYDELASFLTKTRNTSYYVLTKSQADAYSSRLDPSQFDEHELRDYYNEFCESNESDVGWAMLDGVSALKQSLAHLDETSIILFSIG